MDNENEELQDVEEETPEVEETTEEESEEIPEEEHENVQDEPEEDIVTLSKSDYNKLKRRAIAYKKTPKKKQSAPKQVDSVDLIKLGKKLQDYSDEELDFVTDFANSKDPNKILAALENPYVQSGIAAARDKAEKERLAVKPSSTQPEAEMPRSLAEQLSNARTLADKQKILEEAGLYSEPGHNPNRVVIRP